MKKYFAYVLKSKTIAKYYIGHTADLRLRLRKHNMRQVKSTKHGVPWILIHYEIFNNRCDAYKREFQIKGYKGGVAFRKIISGRGAAG